MQHSFTHDGLRFNYFVDDFTDPWANAPALLMIHAAMGNATRWNPWVPSLCRHYRVIRPDLRGHGRTQIPGPENELTLAKLAGDMVALLDHLGIERAHVVGNSAGGYVGQHLAMQHPERMRTLALFGSAPGLKNSQAASWLPKVAEMGLRPFLASTIDDRFPPHLVGTPQAEAFLDALGNNDIPWIARFVGYMATQEWSAELHRIQCPVLAVVPGAGRIGAGDAYRPLRDHIAQCEYLVYDGERHSVCEYLHERCVADLLSFLARHAGA